MKKMKIPGSAIFGVILIIIGIVALLDEIGYIDADLSFKVFWPVAVILMGIKFILDYRSNTFFGIIVTVVGGLFLLDNLEIFYFADINMREVIVPVIIILVGLSFILPRKKKEELIEEVEIVQTESVPVETVVREKTSVAPQVQTVDIEVEEVIK